MDINHSDNRKSRRLSLYYYLRIIDAKSGHQLGNLIDISDDGLMMISDKQIKKGEIIPISMILPEKRVGTKKVEFMCRSVWSKPSINPDFFETGFQIIDIDTDEKLKLVNIIKDIIFED